MSDVITRRGLARALLKLGYNAIQVEPGVYSFSDVWDLLDLYGLIRQRHPDARSPEDLAKRIGVLL